MVDDNILRLKGADIHIDCGNDEKRLVGRLQEYPFVISQGHTIDELIDNIRDALTMLYRSNKALKILKIFRPPKLAKEIPIMLIRVHESRMVNTDNLVDAHYVEGKMKPVLLQTSGVKLLGGYPGSGFATTDCSKVALKMQVKLADLGRDILLDRRKI